MRQEYKLLVCVQNKLCDVFIKTTQCVQAAPQYFTESYYSKNITRQ